MKYRLILVILIAVVTSNSLVWAVWHTSDDLLDDKKFSEKNMKETQEERSKVFYLLDTGLNEGRFSKDDKTSLEVAFYVGSDQEWEEKIFEILSQKTFGSEKNKNYIAACITGSIQKDLREGIEIKAISALDVLTLGSLHFKLQKQSFDTTVREHNKLMHIFE